MDFGGIVMLQTTSRRGRFWPWFTGAAPPAGHYLTHSVWITSKSFSPVYPAPESMSSRLSSLTPLLVKRPSRRSSFSIHPRNDHTACRGGTTHRENVPRSFGSGPGHCRVLCLWVRDHPWGK